MAVVKTAWEIRISLLGGKLLVIEEEEKGGRWCGNVKKEKARR